MVATNSKKGTKYVSIIVPAYRQEKTIQQDIRRIDKTMSKTRWKYEIIIVVDGFLDKTFQNAKKLNRKNVKVFGYESNRGKGFAVRYGMARAKGDYIAFIDAGMDINPNGISLILEHMEWYDADIIVGSKRHPASKITGYPPMRKIYTYGYFIIQKVLFRLRVSDTQVGLKVYKRAVLERVLPRLLVKEFAFDVELLAVAKYLGFKKMYEAPVEISLNPDISNFTPLLFLDNHVRRMLIDTFAIFYRMYILRYYHSESYRSWVYDKELQMRVNTGKFKIK